VLRGFRVVYVFDVSQTDGDALPDVCPVLLTGEVDAGLWDGLAAQVTGHGYTLQRGPCPGEANGVTDPAGRTVRVRADVDPRQAVKTLAHELAHIQCGHTAAGSTYLDCRGRAEIDREHRLRRPRRVGCRHRRLHRPLPVSRTAVAEFQPRHPGWSAQPVPDPLWA
jgi:hypothetical protein